MLATGLTGTLQWRSWRNAATRTGLLRTGDARASAWPIQPMLYRLAILFSGIPSRKNNSSSNTSRSRASAWGPHATAPRLIAPSSWLRRPGVHMAHIPMDYHTSFTRVITRSQYGTGHTDNAGPLASVRAAAFHRCLVRKCAAHQ